MVRLTHLGPIPARRSGPAADRRRLARVVLLALALAGCAGPPAPSGAAGAQVEVWGLRLDQYLGAERKLTLRAGRLAVVPRRFGRFQIATLCALQIADARLELYEPPRAAVAPAPVRVDLGSAVRGLVPGLGTARITAATLAPFSAVVYRGGVPVARLAAQRADPGGSGRTLRLVAFRGEAAAGGARQADEAVWDLEHGTLALRGGERLGVDLAPLPDREDPRRAAARSLVPGTDRPDGSPGAVRPSGDSEREDPAP